MRLPTPEQPSHSKMCYRSDGDRQVISSVWCSSHSAWWAAQIVSVYLIKPSDFLVAFCPAWQAPVLPDWWSITKKVVLLPAHSRLRGSFKATAGLFVTSLTTAFFFSPCLVTGGFKLFSLIIYGEFLQWVCPDMQCKLWNHNIITEFLICAQTSQFATVCIFYTFAFTGWICLIVCGLMRKI